MIYFKSLYNKQIFKYLLIFVILYSALLTFFNFVKYGNEKNEEIKNSESNRTVLIYNIEDNINIEKRIEKYKNKILSQIFNSSTNEYSLVFDTISNKNNFMQENSDLNYGSVILENNSYYKVTLTIFSILLIITIVFIILLIILFSTNLIYNIEENIALFKLIGFPQLKILTILLIMFIAYHVVLYFLSIIIFNFITNNIGDISKIYININNYLMIGTFIIIAILISFLRVIYKVKKITPILLMKEY